jgi:hypothetical protein
MRLRVDPRDGIDYSKQHHRTQGIALRYQENGHVTEPFNQPGKPENHGTVFIYSTSEASDSDSLLNSRRLELLGNWW